MHIKIKVREQPESANGFMLGKVKSECIVNISKISLLAKFNDFRNQYLIYVPDCTPTVFEITKEDYNEITKLLVKTNEEEMDKEEATLAALESPTSPSTVIRKIDRKNSILDLELE